MCWYISLLRLKCISFFIFVKLCCFLLWMWNLIWLFWCISHIHRYLSLALGMHRTRTAVRGSTRTVRVRILEFGFEFEFDLIVRDLKFGFGFGFEFENYPINLAGIECLSGSSSFFSAIRNQLRRHSKFDWVRVRVRVRVFPNTVNFNFNAFSPSVYGLFILFFAYLP
jgi:hypothetical protein